MKKSRPVFPAALSDVLFAELLADEILQAFITDILALVGDDIP